MKKNVYGNIEDMVVRMKMVTPRDTWERNFLVSCLSLAWFEWISTVFLSIRVVSEIVMSLLLEESVTFTEIRDACKLRNKLMSVELHDGLWFTV